MTQTYLHNPCCSAHGVAMSCARYRRTHFVEVRPCCSLDAQVLAAERAAADELTALSQEMGLYDQPHPDVDKSNVFLGEPGGHAPQNLRPDVRALDALIKGADAVALADDDATANLRPEPTEEEAAAAWGPIDVDEAGPEESR